jgi:heme-degrading monooxygenase HmoA
MRLPPMFSRVVGCSFVGAAAVLTLYMLGGCRVGYPFRGPGYDADLGAVLPGTAATVLVVVTRGDIEAGRGKAFANELRGVMDSMNEQDGLVGYAVRKEIFGSRVWTMSVWIDRASVQRFVQSPAHSRAMAEGGIRQASFVTTSALIDASRVPLSWSEAERLLERRTSEE